MHVVLNVGSLNKINGGIGRYAWHWLDRLKNRLSKNGCVGRIIFLAAS